MTRRDWAVVAVLGGLALVALLARQPTHGARFGGCLELPALGVMVGAACR